MDVQSGRKNVILQFKFECEAGPVGGVHLFPWNSKVCLARRRHYRIVRTGGERCGGEKVRFKIPVAPHGLSEISVLETGKPQVQVGFHVVLKRCIERSLGRASCSVERRPRGGTSGRHIFVHMLPHRGLVRHTARVRVHHSR